jgi:hypothetical protein
VDTVFQFHSFTGFAPPFSPGGFPVGPAGDTERRQVEAFLMVMDSNVAPAVGQQVTLRKGNVGASAARVALLTARAQAGDCELTVKTRLFGREAGFLYQANGKLAPDVQGVPPVPVQLLVALAAVEPVSFTCVPLGSGQRVALDRDGDGALDGDEILQGSDPADPASVP